MLLMRVAWLDRKAFHSDPTLVWAMCVLSRAHGALAGGGTGAAPRAPEAGRCVCVVSPILLAIDLPRHATRAPRLRPPRGTRIFE